MRYVVLVTMGVSLLLFTVVSGLASSFWGSLNSYTHNTNHASTLDSLHAYQQTTNKPKRISARSIADLVAFESKDLLIIDARKAQDYNQYHIEHAINLPAKNISSTDILPHINNQKTPVLLYCNRNDCIKPLRALRELSVIGHQRLYYFREFEEQWGEIGVEMVSNVKNSKEISLPPQT